MPDLLNIDQYVRVTTGLYKKNGDPARSAAVTAFVREYAATRLAGLMIDRRDPMVIRAHNEYDQ